MTDSSEIEKRTLTINRTFDAPRQLVWDAWTNPEHIANWWGPAGMKTRVKKHDFKVGGEWEYIMTMPDGKDFISFGVFRKITEPEWVETTANFIPMTEGVTLVVQFVDEGQKTALVFKVIHPTEAYRKQQEEMGFFNGWVSVFNELKNYLDTLEVR